MNEEVSKREQDGNREGGSHRFDARKRGGCPTFRVLKRGDFRPDWPATVAETVAGTTLDTFRPILTNFCK